LLKATAARPYFPQLELLMRVYVMLDVPAAHYSRPPNIAGVTTSLDEAKKWEASSFSHVYEGCELQGATPEEHLEEAQRLLLHNPKPPSAAE
jgi:hypothetical protein